MRFTSSIVFLVATIATLLDRASIGAVQAKKPSRSRAPPPRHTGPPPSRSGGRAPPRRRPRDLEAEEDVYDPLLEEVAEDALDFPEDSDEGEESLAPKRISRRPPPSAKKSRGAAPPRKRPPPRGPPLGREEYDEEDDYESDRPSRPSRSSRPPSRGRRGGPPPSRRGPSPGRGHVVPYGQSRAGQGAGATFAKGWSAFTSAMPDPSSVREGLTSSISAARETTSHLSSNIYREVKGLTSSELEQVMLKATRPDDTPVKGKHVERLVGVTYQISSRYDIYDAVLRKLWGKMAEKDWRTTIKALYILHRFSADGAPEHAQALKARLRELRRTRDPKRKDKYFNSKQLLAGDSKPETIKYRAFMARYAHYVLLRAQCFGGVFDEISQKPTPSKKDKKAAAAPKKPITSTNLRVEHLEAAAMLLKAGMTCQLKEGEECENTAIAAERVASDLIGLTTAVAIALNRALKNDDLEGADPALIRRWCEFYSEELLPQTRAMVKKTSAKLDAYGLFLPSRMGASLSPETLQKGLKAEEWAPGTADSVPEDGKKDEEEEIKDVEEEEAEKEVEEEASELNKETAAGDAVLDDGDEYDEYEYEEEEYYDDEDA